MPTSKIGSSNKKFCTQRELEQIISNKTNKKRKKFMSHFAGWGYWEWTDSRPCGILPFEEIQNGPICVHSKTQDKTFSIAGLCKTYMHSKRRNGRQIIPFMRNFSEQGNPEWMPSLRISFVGKRDDGVIWKQKSERITIEISENGPKNLPDMTSFLAGVGGTATDMTSSSLLLLAKAVMAGLFEQKHAALQAIDLAILLWKLHFRRQR